MQAKAKAEAKPRRRLNRRPRRKPRPKPGSSAPLPRRIDTLPPDLDLQAGSVTAVRSSVPTVGQWYWEQGTGGGNGEPLTDLQAEQLRGDPRKNRLHGTTPMDLQADPLGTSPGSCLQTDPFGHVSFDVEVRLLYDDGNDDYTFDNFRSSQTQGRRRRSAPAPSLEARPVDMIEAHARAALLANGGTDFLQDRYAGRERLISFRGRRPVFFPAAPDPNEDVEFYAEWPDELGEHVSCKPLAVWSPKSVYSVGDGMHVEEFPREVWLKKFK